MSSVKFAKPGMAGMVIAILSLSLGSCMEKNLYQGSNNNETPSTATFATTQDVQFTLQYTVPEGYAAGFDVYTENPVIIDENGSIILRTDIKPIAAGIAVSGSFDILKRIPAYAQELYAYSDDLFAPRLMHATITDGKATFQAVDFSALIPDVKVNVASTRSTADRKIDFWPELDEKYTPAIDDYMSLPIELYYAIRQAFPEGKSLETINPDYMQDATMEVKEDAELWVTPLMTGCAKVNTLGYICFDGPKSGLPADVSQLTEKTHIIFPFASLATNTVAHRGVTGINTGQLFKLKYYDKKQDKLVDTFPEGTTVVWFLCAGIYNKDTRTASATLPKASSNYPSIYFSHSAWNTVEKEEYKSHTTYFSVNLNNEKYHFFGFEDSPRSKDCDGDFNDMVFMLKSNPSLAINPPTEIDGDTKTVTTKTENIYGVLAFEDNWPAEGDYDMNDVIVKYNSTISYAKEYQNVCVVSTEDIFTLAHSGASFENGFSIKYDIDPTSVVSVMVNGKAINTRPDGSGYIVDITPNVLRDISAYVPGQSFPYQVTTHFVKNKIIQSAFQKVAAPYNPYITPKAGIEVHLPMYKPTEGAYPIHFGTKNDCSNPDKGIYYVGKEGSAYPWAINLAGVEEFTPPTEREPIETTYPRFTDWVNSNFKSYTDWYVK